MAGSGRPRLAGEEEAHRRVRIPYYPLYSEVRHLLCVWPGRLRKQVTGLQTNLGELRGNPQKTADWTDPATWIPERLAGGDLELAQAVWDQSKGAVNPRFTHGHWLLAHRYLLDEDGNGILELTEAGQDFLKHPGGGNRDEGRRSRGLDPVAFHRSGPRPDLAGPSPPSRIRWAGD